jgi:hypothetical protein
LPVYVITDHIAEDPADGGADQRALGVAADDLAEDGTSGCAAYQPILGGLAGLDVLAHEQ